MLTLQTALGFTLTLVTIHLMPYLVDTLGWRYAFAAAGDRPGARACGRWRGCARIPARSSSPAAGARRRPAQSCVLAHRRPRRSVATGVASPARIAACRSPTHRRVCRRSDTRKEESWRYHLEGRLLEVCNCRVLCPCWIGEDPDFGTCDTIVAWHFDKGTIDGVDVSDRTIALIAHVPGNILQGNWRAAVYLDERVTPAQEAGDPRRLHRQAGRPRRRPREARRRGRVGRKGSRSRSPCRAASGTIKLGDAGYAELEPYTSATRRDDDADRHRVLDGARRAGVRRQGAALPVEERQARHRPRHQGPQRAAEHVRVRRLSGAIRRRARVRRRRRIGRGHDGHRA